MSKDAIRKLGLKLGADVVGFASIEDYHSERSPDPKTVMPQVKSLIVLGYREIDGALDSNNDRTSLATRLGAMDFSKANNCP